MTGNYTLTIIKPDAFTGGKTGKILALLEAKGFVVRAARAMQLTKEQAGAFFEVHNAKAFYGELVEVMTSGPCIPLLLPKKKKVAGLRHAAGAPEPPESPSGALAQ